MENINELKQVINEFGISMPKISKKMNMSVSSFKKKISNKYKNSFSDLELQRLNNIINELKNKVESCV